MLFGHEDIEAGGWWFCQFCGQEAPECMQDSWFWPVIVDAFNQIIDAVNDTIRQFTEAFRIPEGILDER